MRYLRPNKVSGVALYIRSDPEDPSLLSAEDQEFLCTRYCTDNGLPIMTVIREQCDARESLNRIRKLLITLPETVDTVFAARFNCYSIHLRELGLLCMQFQCRNAWIYSLDVIGPLYQMLNVIEPYDYMHIDEIYAQTIKELKAAEAAD